MCKQSGELIEPSQWDWDVFMPEFSLEDELAKDRQTIETNLPGREGRLKSPRVL
jgi:hypothetical protein